MAKQPRSVKLAPAFPRPEAIEVGSVIFDRDYEMPGTVREVDAPFIEMSRPTGLTWRVHFRRLRPATEWEQRQLVAVGRLHRQRQKGRP
ncbi:hypothetical protein [Streptomyces sp. H27-C3]|uniref:hypothetical protein n=1 Tax=Streptomyces sp. H27-C3 TaxID=3046305 RepID=UPI0024BA9169|nr:hypothetical protein [Streptomyces sp. H27-C3]MDJ0461982.1 hypothetical protein [Streptomyces sp. H27-C3]